MLIHIHNYNDIDNHHKAIQLRAAALKLTKEAEQT